MKKSQPQNDFHHHSLFQQSNKASIPFLFLFLFLFQSILPPQPQVYSRAITIDSITMNHNNNSDFSASDDMPSSSGNSSAVTHQKRLRRLPHVFSKVLQLPFSSDADVSVQETHDCFRFVAETREVGDDVRALAVEIHPGVTKIVVRNGAGDAELSLRDMEVDVWRFRLPESTLPDSATAVFADGKLVVTVPKRTEIATVEVFGGLGQLVLVQ